MAKLNFQQPLPFLLNGPLLQPLIRWNYPAAPLLPEHSSHLVMILSFIPVAFRPDQQRHRARASEAGWGKEAFWLWTGVTLSWVCYQWISSPGETAVGLYKGYLRSGIHGIFGYWCKHILWGIVELRLYFSWIVLNFLWRLCKVNVMYCFYYKSGWVFKLLQAKLLPTEKEMYKKELATSFSNYSSDWPADTGPGRSVSSASTTMTSNNDLQKIRAGMNKTCPMNESSSVGRSGLWAAH